jgi:hypothetical protein
MLLHAMAEKTSADFIVLHRLFVKGRVGSPLHAEMARTGVASPTRQIEILRPQ